MKGTVLGIKKYSSWENRNKIIEIIKEHLKILYIIWLEINLITGIYNSKYKFINTLTGINKSMLIKKL